MPDSQRLSRRWWKEAVVYQIYPKSFKDSNGDGIGDIPGIIEKLDYVASLGVDVIWLNPVYESPEYDNGYDISDYQAILKSYGTMEDVETLIEEVHTRKMRIIMDLVVNHTSSEHPWFLSSSSEEPGEYADFYHWHPGDPKRTGGLPNNWRAYFGGDAWSWDEGRKQYYLHLFTPEQPDLNWENESVRQEIFKMMNWWLSKGIDGFRMDVISMISKPEGLSDCDPECHCSFGAPYMDGPEVHRYLKQMAREVLSRYDCMTVGECPGVTSEAALPYTDERSGELNMIFQFEHMQLEQQGKDTWKKGFFDLRAYKRIVSRWYEALYPHGWNCWYWMNHDQPRAVSRFGDEGPYREASAKVLLSVLLTLPGTPFIFQGEELGMINPGFTAIEQYRDVWSLNRYREALSEGVPGQQILEQLARTSRDNARTPMQWDASIHAGFSTHTPWIDPAASAQEIHVSGQEKDEDSVLNYSRTLIGLRRSYPTLVYGSFELLDPESEYTMCYRREDEAGSILVLHNLSSVPQRLPLLISTACKKGKLLLSTYRSEDIRGVDDELLQPWESQIWQVST